MHLLLSPPPYPASGHPPSLRLRPLQLPGNGLYLVPVLAGTFSHVSGKSKCFSYSSGHIGTVREAKKSQGLDWLGPRSQMWSLLWALDPGTMWQSANLRCFHAVTLQHVFASDSTLGRLRREVTDTGSGAPPPERLIWGPRDLHFQ